jgi:hypothetical protein
MHIQLNLRLNTLAVPGLLMLLSACSAGSGEGLDQNGNPTDSNETITLADNFKSIQANIFIPSCAVSGCHSGTAPQVGMSLEAGKSFAAIAKQASSEVPSLLRIKPGSPDDSYLLRKVRGIASIGVQMPRNAPALSSAKIEALRSWIEKGALGPTLSSIQANVLSPVCTQCHFGNNPAAGMNLEEGEAYANLVGIKRSFDAEIRVVAGDADNSFIIDKLEGNKLGGSRGDRMPLGGPFLTQDVIDVIRDWIDAGAKDD